MSALSVDVRRKVFPASGTVALEGVRFEVESGEFLALVGPSGAGKTTLLNLIAGLDRALDGDVVLDAGEGPGTGAWTGAGAPAPVPSATSPLAMVFQSPRLMPWLTVEDNVRLVLPRSGAEEEAEVRRLLGDLGLEGFEKAWPAQLSGGMQRRVALARAFAVRPRVLLMDEPFVSLDAPLAERLRERLMALWRRLRPTVLYVTHDLREALALADRVLFLSPRPGRVVLDQAVGLPRPRSIADPAVTALEAELLARHPELLAGSLAPGDTPQPDATPEETTP